MTIDVSVVILTVLYATLLFFVAKTWLTNRLRKSGLSANPASRAQSIYEQRLLMETISACAWETEVPDILKAIGSHSAEILGCNNWIIWLEEKGAFGLRAHGGRYAAGIVDKLGDTNDTAFSDWVTRNAAPMSLSRKEAVYADIRTLKVLLGSLERCFVIPFNDSMRIIGFLIVGDGRRRRRDFRSTQFLGLLGAFAAFVIRKGLLHQQERELRGKQYQAEKIAALGKLAASVAHEIRNPLTCVRSIAEYFSMIQTLQPEDHDMANGLLDEIDRINVRVEELLSFSQAAPEAFQTVEIGQLIDETLRIVETKARQRDIIIETKIDTGKTMVLGSADNLKQLLLNVVLNGIDAIPEGRKGAINVSSRVRDGECLIDVRDNGCGIKPEHRAAIFEPLFTTKKSGTGLGLSICFNIAKNHGGGIELLETSENGSCFRITIPVLPDRGEIEEGGWL